MTDTVIVIEPQVSIVETDGFGPEVTVESPSTIVEIAVQEAVTVEVTMTDQIRIVEAGSQGPAGPPGLPGSGAETFILEAAEPISGHTAISIDEDGLARRSSIDDLGELLSVAGIAENAAIIGGDVTVRNSGSIDHPGWSWTPNQPVFVGIDGILIQTLPPGAVGVRVVGAAVSATRIQVDVQPLILLA